MKFLDWIKDFFGVDQAEIYVTQNAIRSQETQLSIELFAITTAINLIAGAVSKCEFKTYIKGEETKADEYYLWNIEPNKNQNSSQFLQELVSKLLFYNECLVVDVGGQLIIADNFSKDEKATVESYFTGVTRGTMTFDRSFRMSEVLYFKLGSSDVKAQLSTLMAGYNAIINMTINKYKRSGGRKGILSIDAMAQGDKDFQKKFDDLMNNRFKSYFESENAVLPLHKGFNYEEQGGEASKKASNEIADLSTITKEAFERAAQAFKIPAPLLRGDIADIGQMTDNFLTFCIDPICDIITEEVVRKRYRKAAFLAGTFLRIDTTCIKHTDIFSISAAFDKLIASGGYCIDELRIKCGDLPLNKVWSRKHYITKNYTGIEDPEGGKTS